jgi:hypothetical protein
MTMTIKATEIQVGDTLRFSSGVVTRVRINKRVSVLQEGYAGVMTYPLDAYVQVERPEA